MTLFDWTYEKAVEKAESLIDTGQTTIHLPYNAEDFPWHIAETVEDGCSKRMDISTGFRVTGKDECGLTFTWSFDIESMGANGKGHYEIDTAGLIEVFAKMPIPAREQLGQYLQRVADAVEEKGKQYLDIYSKQMKDAFAVRQIVAATVLQQHGPSNG